MNRNILLYLGIFVLSGCGIQASFMQSLSQSPTLPPGIDIPSHPIAGVITDPSKADFLKSDVFVGSFGVADGDSQLLVVIRLMNSDNTVVAGYRPDFSIIKGVGAVGTGCSASSKDGISICGLRSSDPGVKTLRYQNLADFHPEKDVVFYVPSSPPSSVGNSGGDLAEATSPSGWRMTASVGTHYGKAVTKKNGYELKLGPIRSTTE